MEELNGVSPYTVDYKLLI